MVKCLRTPAPAVHCRTDVLIANASTTPFSFFCAQSKAATTTTCQFSEWICVINADANREIRNSVCHGESQKFVSDCEIRLSGCRLRTILETNSNEKPKRKVFFNCSTSPCPYPCLVLHAFAMV